jgi:hypothetical protein
VLAVVSCGSENSSSSQTSTHGSGTGGATSTGTANGGAGGDLFGTGGGTSTCSDDGAECGDGGVCAGGACCDADKACGMNCCAAAEVCSFQKCVTPGATCIDASECAADEYCEYSLGDPGDPGSADAGCMGGAEQKTGKCMPKPPECDPGNEPGPNDPITCLAKCEYKPAPAPFSPVLKYSWGDPGAPSTKDSVMMAPVVIELDDDNCDGVVDERDIPEIVFSTFETSNYNGNGTLHAISIVDGQVVEKWSVNEGVNSPINPGRSIAAGNIDGQPGNEIVVCTTDNRVRAYRADGTQLWLSESTGACAMPSIADLDQDGMPEVIVESRILEGATGKDKVAAFDPPNGANMVVSDLDGDGKLDIVTPTRAYRGDGTLIGPTEATSPALTGSYVAVGDLDRDGVPEVVVSNTASHALIVWHLDAQEPSGVKVVRYNVDINGALDPATVCSAGSAGYTKGGGPPTVADFDGDGFPDVALAGGVGYSVFSGKKLMDPNATNPETVLWTKQTHDCSSAATGSSVFDFDGDGKAEVVYADEKALHVYDGVTGQDLSNICNTSGTLVEYPLVADVDNDGQADIVVASNSYSGITCEDKVTKTSGVRIFGDANGAWVRTRRVWNEHGYHVTNVDESGAIPKIELPNYTQPKLDNFRQNVQPLGEFSAPNLVATLFPRCDGAYGLVARVRNVGEASAPAGIPVGFYLGLPNNGGTLLGKGATTKVLYPAEAEDVIVELPMAPAGVADGKGDLYAVVGDGPAPQTFHECRTDDNVSAAAHGACGSPK